MIRVEHSFVMTGSEGNSMDQESKSPNKSTRRDFGRVAAGAAVGVFGAPAFLKARNVNDLLNIACIGVGGQGGSNLRNVSSQNIVALCDVYMPNVDRAAQTHTKAEKFQDFRRLFDHANKFDAVVVSTTEHTHAFATLPALQLGKHVYCEKPLTHDVYGARVIRDATAKAKVATQMGTQIHAGDNYRRVVELVQAGAIGDVTEAHVWVGRAWGRQSAEDATKNHDIVSVRERPTEAAPLPKGLDWEIWLGPAPERAFHQVYFPGPKWYRWWDFGNGTMSDLGSHWIDLPWWALKLQAPLTIEAFGPPPHAEIAPASMRAVYEYGPRGEMPALKLTWYQGSERPELIKNGTIPNWDSGVLFVGSKGMLLSDYSKHTLLPEKNFVDFKRPAESIPKSIGHHAEWIHACKTGAPTTCNFEYASRLTEANHLGNVAYRIGKKLEWDAVNGRVKNSSEAEPLIQRAYRKGWKLS
jgi:hypothetical protein